MGAVKPPLVDEVLRLPFAVTANASVVETWWAPARVEVVKIQARIAVVAVSASGTYTLTVASKGRNLLLPVTFDLESLVAGKVTTVPLTAVLKDLILEEDQEATFTVTSNNVDLTGSGLVLHVRYRRNK